MAEAVRLLVWDLDETFWKGTVTEGGITEYVQAHHDIVIELARRGIMSSICSKNDAATIMPVLEEHGIAEYFIFPRISWEPKGMRLMQLIDDVQLRAPTVMFIDDNPNNLAEARAMIPEIQVEDESFIPKILADPRFKGKDDSELSRLKQYKLLEKRKTDEKSTKGSNDDFLRGCNIRVYIETDVEKYIDRAIELINRTNQLNYTKLRLPENFQDAKNNLIAQISGINKQAGLVRVIDDYGDYGFVGFYLYDGVARNFPDGTTRPELLHYCFSCRTLGMYVEQWVYNHLGRPYLNQSGDVLTDLSINHEIDWITQILSLAELKVKIQKTLNRIYLHGGCEMQSIGIYLNNFANSVKAFGNYNSSGFLFAAKVSFNFFSTNRQQIPKRNRFSWFAARA